MYLFLDSSALINVSFWLQCGSIRVSDLEFGDNGPILNVITMDALNSFTNTFSITLPPHDVGRHLKTFVIGTMWVPFRIFKFVQLSICMRNPP